MYIQLSCMTYVLCFQGGSLLADFASLMQESITHMYIQLTVYTSLLALQGESVEAKSA